MTPVRTVAAAAAVLALLAGGAADAAQNPSARGCPLITDATGDATGTDIGPYSLPAGTPPPPTDDYLDIVSADLATDGENVRAALRMKALGTDVTSPHTSDFAVLFRLAGLDVKLTASRITSLGSWSYSWFSSDGHYGDGSGTIDASRNEIRMTFPAEAISFRLVRGARLTHIRAESQRFLPIGLGAFMTVDTASTRRTVVAGSRPCGRPGPGASAR